jgi:hypothetical protein
MRRVLGVAAALLATSAWAEDATINAVQLPTFQGAGVGERVQGLTYLGGLQLSSATDTFGGLSAIGFTGTDGKLVMVSDRGNFVSGQLIYDEANRPLSLVGVQITPIQNSRGAELPSNFARDAEALTVIERPDNRSVLPS